MSNNIIPPITDPLGKYWKQPKPEDMLMFSGHVIMSDRAVNKLAEYSHSIPTGTYAGKMWKRKVRGGFALCWYGLPYVDPKDDKTYFDILHKHILVRPKEWIA